MKRVLSITFGIFFIAGLLNSLWFIGILGNVEADVQYVNPGESIQSAIDGAQPGDTIFVNAGTYNENVTITKSIELVGESQQATILNCGGVPFGVIISQTSSVSVKSLTIKNANFGISIFDTTDSEIRDVKINECGSGIDADNDEDFRIRDCELTGYGTGTAIDAYSIENLSVENNTISLFLNGMSLRYSEDPYVYGNTVTFNLDNGIIMEQFSGGTLENNYIANHATNGVKIYRVEGVEIKGNNIFNTTNRGFFASRSEFKIYSTSIDKSGVGVMSNEVSNGKIFDSVISNSNYADVNVSLDYLELINTSFDHSKVMIFQQDATLTVRNYIGIVVVDSLNIPVEGAFVKVIQDEQVIYDSKEGETTDSNGKIIPISVVYGVYQFSQSANYSLSKKVIGASVKYNSIPVPFDGPDPQNIDMAKSRDAYFVVDTLPPHIYDISIYGNVSQTKNTLDRSQDDSLAIFLNTDEAGEFHIIFDSDMDGKFNESYDIILSGTMTSGFQTIFWTGGNETVILSDGYYPIQINIRDEFYNWLSEPFSAITVIIKNSDMDGDGHPDIHDDLPSNPTQWYDNDGDGYGDNPNGEDADMFPQDPTQWFDFDGDGYGDNPEGNNPDMLPEDETQHIDSDGDGYGDNVSGNYGDAFPHDVTQWLDTDGDGYGDNQSGNMPDAFPKNIYEWEDSDGDGYGDNSADAFPDDPDEWLDEDGDGMGDNSDFLPGINNWLFFFIIGITVVIIIVGFYVFKGQKRSERPFDPGVSSQPPASVSSTAPVKEKRVEKPKAAQPKKKSPPKKGGPPKAEQVKPEPGKKAPSAKPVLKKEAKVPMVGVPKPSEEHPPPPPPPKKKEEVKKE